MDQSKLELFLKWEKKKKQTKHKKNTNLRYTNNKKIMYGNESQIIFVLLLVTIHKIKSDDY